MRVVVEKANPEEVSTFTQSLANTLKCPVFRWDKDQEGARGVVFEFETLTTEDIKNAEKVVDDIADNLDIDVFFLDYGTRKRRM